MAKIPECYSVTQPTWCPYLRKERIRKGIEPRAAKGE